MSSQKISTQTIHSITNVYLNTASECCQIFSHGCSKEMWNGAWPAPVSPQVFPTQPIKTRTSQEQCCLSMLLTSLPGKKEVGSDG